MRNYSIRKHNIVPPVVNGDQMPIHRNESSEQKNASVQEPKYIRERKPHVGFQGNVFYHFFFFQRDKSHEHLRKTILNLPNRYNMFSEKNVSIYVLDDYAVHLTPDVRKTLYERDYILGLIGGGITCDAQINDTHMHPALKRHYRDEEAELMLKKLDRK